MAKWKYTDRNLRSYLVGDREQIRWDAVAVDDLRERSRKISLTLKDYYNREERAIEKGRSGVLYVGDMEELEMLYEDFEWLSENIGLGTPHDEGIEVDSWIEYFGEHAERLYDLADTALVDQNECTINEKFLFVDL